MPLIAELSAEGWGLVIAAIGGVGGGRPIFIP